MRRWLSRQGWFPWKDTLPSSKPACEYLDGVLTQKPLPTWDHGAIQSQSIQLIAREAPGLFPAAEITVQLRTGRFLVPDVVVQDRARLQRPYPLDPVHLCIEVLSPSDRVSDVLAKCEEYHAWGVPTAWIIDPDERRAWEYRAGQRPVEILVGGRLTTDRVSISVDELFSVLER